MPITQKQKLETFQCRCCDKVFELKDMRYEIPKYTTCKIPERICPYCGSNRYGWLDYPIDEKELIYKDERFYDERFYGMSNKRLEYMEKYEELKEVIDELYI